MSLQYAHRAYLMPAHHLLGAQAFPGVGTITGSAALPWQPLCLSGLAALEVTSEMQQGVRVYTAKLTAVLSQPPGQQLSPVAFRLGLTDGSFLVLGTHQRPFPVVATTDTHPARPSERCALTLTATLTGPLPPLLEV